MQKTPITIVLPMNVNCSSQTQCICVVLYLHWKDMIEAGDFIKSCQITCKLNVWFWNNNVLFFSINESILGNTLVTYFCNIYILFVC